MVHPSALVGKITHSLLDIGNATKDLIFREYNKDASPGKVSYRDAGLAPFRASFLGRPDVAQTILPYLAVSFGLITYDDAPQDAGSDNTAEIKIFLYGQEKRRKEQEQEAIKMVECVRHIILDNPTVPTKEGTEQVFQLGYLQSTAEFAEQVFENFQGDVVGVDVGILTVQAVFAEKGF